VAAHGDLISVQLFSSLKNQGVDELRATLDGWLTETDGAEETEVKES
jgi:hypothetical protein